MQNPTSAYSQTTHARCSHCDSQDEPKSLTDLLLAEVGHGSLQSYLETDHKHIPIPVRQSDADKSSTLSHAFIVVT